MTGRGMCVPGETATAADSTHPTGNPTGMHSCQNFSFLLVYFYSLNKTINFTNLTAHSSLDPMVCRASIVPVTFCKDPIFL